MHNISLIIFNAQKSWIGCRSHVKGDHLPLHYVTNDADVGARKLLMQFVYNVDLFSLRVDVLLLIATA